VRRDHGEREARCEDDTEERRTHRTIRREGALQQASHEAISPTFIFPV